jgi:glucose/mannose-6-phosphate isomerase
VPERLDTLGMDAVTRALPEQVADALRRFETGIDGLPARREVDTVLVLGLGGSGIAGDVLAAVAGPACPVPIVVHKDYEVPGFINPRTLVLAVSCSGNTEETLAVAGAAASRGARLVAVSQGGHLRDLAARTGAPWLAVPADLAMPRTAIGALTVPLCCALEDAGLWPEARTHVAAAAAQLARRRDQLEATGEPYRTLARRIDGTFPLVYGGGAVGAVAAARWKGQVNEHAKAPAFANRVPELCHNEAAGWGQHGDVTRQVLTIVRLRHDFEHPQVAKRFALVDELVLEVVADLLEVRAEGEVPLAQLLDLVLVGDYTALELAATAGVDPGPIPSLDWIKANL